MFVVKTFRHNKSPDPVVLDGVIVPDGQREVVPPGLGVPDQEGAVLVLAK